MLFSDFGRILSSASLVHATLYFLQIWFVRFVLPLLIPSITKIVLLFWILKPGMTSVPGLRLLIIWIKRVCAEFWDVFPLLDSATFDRIALHDLGISGNHSSNGTSQIVWFLLRAQLIVYALARKRVRRSGEFTPIASWVKPVHSLVLCRAVASNLLLGVLEHVRIKLIFCLIWSQGPVVKAGFDVARADSIGHLGQNVADHIALVLSNIDLILRNVWQSTPAIVILLMSFQFSAAAFLLIFVNLTREVLNLDILRCNLVLQVILISLSMQVLKSVCLDRSRQQVFGLRHVVLYFLELPLIPSVESGGLLPTAKASRTAGFH